MRLDAFWRSDRWHQYERLHDGPPGARAGLLARASWQTRVVDLSPDEATLWRGVRKSYHATINRLTREYPDEIGQEKTRAVLCGAGAGGLIRTAQEVHRLDAGRETRPAETWDLYGDWLDDEGALLALAFDGTRGTFPERTCVGYGLFIIADGWAYYASAASLQRDVNIALVWWALLVLKARGVRWLEMGWQGQDHTEKGHGIEFFRRGFGGVDVSLTAELPEA